MPHVTYEPFGTSDARSATALNDILLDIAARTNPVDAANFAEEGIDQAVVEPAAHADRRDRVAATVRAVVAPQAFGLFTVGATNMQTGALGALLADSALRVRSFVRCETSNSAPAGFGFDNVNDEYQFRHAWDDGVSTTTIDFSRRSRGQIVQPVIYHGLHGSIAWESWLFGPLANVAFIQLEYQNLGAGNIRVDQAQLEVTEFKRIRRL